MNNEEKIYKGCFWAFLMFVVLMAIILLSSCHTQYVSVETIRKEIKEVHDTLRVKDSIKNEKQIIIREADTAEVERLNREYDLKLDKARQTILMMLKEKESQSHLRTEVKDSIVYKDKEVQVPYPVEKKLSKWEQIKIDLGGWMVGFIILSIIAFCVYLARGKVYRGIK